MDDLNGGTNMETRKELIRTDRNGTKYWNVTETCPRCGGRGDYILGSTNYGICFQCRGSGVHEYTWKEYTPEHEAELEARRQKKAEAKLAISKAHEDETKKYNMLYEGFSEDGVGYIHYGDTYKAKSVLKQGGARWNSDLKAWIAPKSIEYAGVSILEVKAEELCNAHGRVDWDKAYEMRKRLS